MGADIRYVVLIDKAMDDRLSGDLSHIQVTESVKGTTTFSVKVELDICKKNFSLVDEPALQPSGDGLITVVAYVNNVSQVLAHGKVTQQSKNLRRGGPGSSIEVLAADRRIEMDRNFTPTAGPRQ